MPCYKIVKIMDRILLEFFINYILPILLFGLWVVIMWAMLTDGGTKNPFNDNK